MERKIKSYRNKLGFYSVIGAALVLLIPLIAMQFTNEVNWNWADFVLIGILLFSASFSIELAVKRLTTFDHKLIAIIIVLIIFILIWAELAVGVFGTPLAGS